MIGNLREKRPILRSPPQNKLYRNQGSPTKATTQLQADCSEYINGLKAKRQNYSTALSLYQACYENELPQKCLKHLDYINLYCDHQRKLMCVNCLYGSTAHKNHTVTPSNKSQTQIRQDNEKNIKQIEDQIEEIKEGEARIHQNKRVLDSESQTILRDIDNEFAQIYKMIQNKHKEVRQRAIYEFRRASQENQTSSQEIGWWRQQMQNTKNRLPKESKNEDAELYKHLVLERMLEQKLQTDKLTYIASKEEIENQFLDEVRDLKETIKHRVQNLSEEHKSSNRVKLF